MYLTVPALSLQQHPPAFIHKTSLAPTSSSDEIAEVRQLLQSEKLMRQSSEDEVSNLKSEVSHWKNLEAAGNAEIMKLRKMLDSEANQKQKLEEEIAILKSQLLQLSLQADEVCKANQEKIVEAGGLTSLLMLLRSSEDETIRRVAAGAIANLAMNVIFVSSNILCRFDIAFVFAETNQELIMAQGGITLLSITAADAEDPQTLRMVAGAIANLCGNDKLQMRLSGEGGIKALLGMVRCGHPDVLAQVARGIANFAKCESRASTQGKLGLPCYWLFGVEQLLAHL
ncbi:hypothetical protein BHM03_00010347 [Ensete ventricosum]|nr:hypothetical protein BHM03_00010347 [Ensete ventricosum]